MLRILDTVIITVILRICTLCHYNNINKRIINNNE